MSVSTHELSASGEQARSRSLVITMRPILFSHSVRVVTIATVILIATMMRHHPHPINRLLSPTLHRITTSLPKSFPSHRMPSPVAVMITGQLRTFFHPGVSGSILHDVVRPLKLAGYPTHVFFHVEDASLLNATILQPFRPCNVSSFVQRPCGMRPQPCKFPSRSVRWPFTLCRSQDAWRQVQEFEVETKRHFDWIYRVRPDTAFAHSLPLPDVLEKDTVNVNRHIYPDVTKMTFPTLQKLLGERTRFLADSPGDHVAIAPRNQAGVLFEAVRAFEECGIWNDPVGVNPETGLAFWLAKHEIRLKVHRWAWMLVREKRGPECYRMRFIGVNRTDVERRVAECVRMAKSWGFEG